MNNLIMKGKGYTCIIIHHNTFKKFPFFIYSQMFLLKKPIEFEFNLIFFFLQFLSFYFN